MIELENIELLLSRQAEEFEEASQPAGETLRGWGQFLDAPRSDTQVGPYGTCAGLIVLSLAGRGKSPTSKGAAALLNSWWAQRDQGEYQRQRFAQNLRLALLALALRLSPLSETADTYTEVETSILERRLPSGGWGDWWLGLDRYDPTPSTVVTGVVMLALLLLRSGSLPESYLNNLNEDGEFLRRALLGSSHLSPLERAIAVAATTAWESSRGTMDRRRVVPNAIWRPVLEQTHGSYFFFYEYPSSRQGQSFGRDYLLAPLNLLIGIAGFHAATTSNLRLAAVEILEHVAADLEQNEGVYRVERREHVSTLDQAWAALLLAQAIASQRTGLGLPKPLSRLWYALVKERRGNFFTDKLVPIFSFIFLVVANAGPWTEDLIIKIALSLGTAIVAAIYGDDLIRRFLPRGAK